MFVGVVVENFHRCREEQEKEERVRRAAKRALQLEKRRRSKHDYFSDLLDLMKIFRILLLNCNVKIYLRIKKNSLLLELILMQTHLSCT